MYWAMENFLNCVFVKTPESHHCDALPFGHTAETVLPGAQSLEWWALGHSSHTAGLGPRFPGPSG